MNERDTHSGLFWPALLVAAGIILLLNNLGRLDWTVWEVLFRLWPVLLIAWGLDLLVGRRSILGGLLSLILIVAVFVGSLMWMNQIDEGRQPVAEHITEPLEDLTSAQFFLDPAIGDVQVYSLTDTSQLFEAGIPAQTDRYVYYSYSTSANQAEVNLGLTGSVVMPGFWGVNQDLGWDIALTDEIPIEIQMDMGVGRVELDLSDMTVEKVNVDFGVGEAVLRLPDHGYVSVTVDSGVGQTTIIIPETMAAQIEIDEGLSGHTIPVKYEHDGDIYTSPDYATAHDRIDIYVSQGIGQISIRHAGDH
ncbi:MAG: hypothetical protein JXA25_12095 [Anaerolineales bacterium]|nr:hypothetical protein [Anaerolineales bacterium]